MASGSQWPPLSGGRENSAWNTNERILDANYDWPRDFDRVVTADIIQQLEPYFGYGWKRILNAIHDLAEIMN